MLNINSIRLLQITLQIAHLQIRERIGLLPMADNAAKSAAEQVEPPANRLHQVGVEAVEADELFVGKIGGLVPLLAKQPGARFLAVEKDQPVTLDAFLTGLDEIDLAAVFRDF